MPFTGIRFINSATEVIPETYDPARVANLGDVPICNMLNLTLLNTEVTTLHPRVIHVGIVRLFVNGDHSIT
jgi:hypothetical protein